MKPVFENPSALENNVKSSFSFPSFIMMENAASALSECIKSAWNTGKYDSIIFLCGKGNNGADGLACARMLFLNLPVFIYCPELPETEEGAVQAEMCRKLKIPFISKQKLLQKTVFKNIFVDCIYGTGFHGKLPEETIKIFQKINSSESFRIACDISSGLAFNAHETLTMGSLKAALFSDKAKAVSGKIKTAELGISCKLFESASKTDIFLLEESDVNLPFRNKADTHKGSFGHAAVFSGTKSGASILSAEASINFGSGLTSLIRTDVSNLSQLKINPEIMIADEIPKNVKSIQIGSGLGNPENPEIQKIIHSLETWFTSTKNPACVIDADMFTWKELPAFLKKLNKIPDVRIVLTPHAKELANLFNTLRLTEKNLSKEIPFELNAESALEHRLTLGRVFTKIFPQIILVMKGANTFIASKGKIFIFAGGSPALSKGGSGDVLAGMINSLLAQGYNAQNAAITSVYRHGSAAEKIGKKNYNLTAQKLISLI